MILYTSAALASPSQVNNTAPSTAKGLAIQNVSAWTFRFMTDTDSFIILPMANASVPLNGGQYWSITPVDEISMLTLSIPLEVSASYLTSPVTAFTQTSPLPVFSGNVSITNSTLDVNATIQGGTVNVGTVSGTVTVGGSVDANITNATLDIGTISSISGTVNTNITNATLDIGNVGAISGTVAISGNVGILVGQSISLTGTAIVEPSSSSGMPVTTGSGGLDVSVTNTVNAQITSSTVTLPISIADTVNMAITSSTVTVDSNIQNGVVPGNNLVYLGSVQVTLAASTTSGSTSWSITGAIPSLLCDAVYLATNLSNGNVPSWTSTITSITSNTIPNLSSANLSSTDLGTAEQLTASGVYTYLWKVPIEPAFLLNGCTGEFKYTSINGSGITLTFAAWGRYASAEVVNSVDNAVNTDAIPNAATYFSIAPEPTSTSGTQSLAYNLNPSGGTLVSVTFLPSAWYGGSNPVYNGNEYLDQGVTLENGSSPVQNLYYTGDTGFTIEFDNIPNDGLNVVFNWDFNTTTTAANTPAFTGYVVTK